MCGIIGIVGKNATEAVLSGLSTLEYRGYDSCGLCYKKQSSLVVKKVAGRVSGLKALPMENSTVAIGHTRWATHGKPSAENSHPHLSYDGNFAIVHNGIVENLGEVKSILKSVPLKSQTDSELIAHLLAHFYAGSVREAVERTAETLKGTFTFLAMSVYDDNVYAYRKNAGLIVGLGDGFGVVASDVTALSSLVENAVVLADDDLAVIGEDSVEFFRFGRRVEKTSVPVSLYKTSPLSADTYMQSEIDEIPSALLSTVTSLLSPEGLSSFTESSRFDNVFISGCGTAYHASLYGKTVFEKIAKIKTYVEVASEIKNHSLHLSPTTLAVFVSQSGETRDTISALRYAKSLGAYTVCLTNIRGSSLSVEADFSLYLDCGAEIAVAATKTLASQMIALYLFASYVAKENGVVSKADFTSLVFDAKKLEIAARKAVCSDLAETVAKETYDKKVLFLGSGQDYPSALEGALKLKEITYKSAEAYRLGELKHGPIALVDDDTFCIVAITDKSLVPRAEITLSELETRGAKTIAVTPFPLSHSVLKTDEAPLLLSPILTVIHLQKYALAVCLRLRLDPDKPRNLAKSVTVL